MNAQETETALRDIGIDPAEATLFHVVHYGLTVPPSDLCRRTVSYALGVPVTPEESQAALDRCLSKGSLQIVDAAVLGRLHNEVRRQGLLGPVYGYPDLGGVEFTHAGAEQWFRICKRLWNGGRDESFAFRDVVHEKTSHFFASKSAALSECDHLNRYNKDIVSITDPCSIGPWRAQWWRRFPEGYRVDVEQRRKWQGRCSDVGGHFFLNALMQPFDVPRAKDVLDRHNMTWGEWLVMAGLEHTTDECDLVSLTAEKSERLGEAVPEAVCLGALRSCVRNGWLRSVDEQVIADIRKLLQADSTFMPVPFDPVRQQAEIDFSAAGAQLYRMVSAEILGEDWEERLSVEDTTFVEEHRYCATEAGIHASQAQDAQAGNTPRSIRIVPIGPWCVRWWQQFSSGFRAELTFGKP